MTLPDVVVGPRELAFLVPQLEGDYQVHCMWNEPTNRELAKARALVCLGHQSPEHLVSILPEIGLVACFTTGYDGIDVQGLNSRGIQVSHAPGATAEPVAEFALALILASYRNVVTGDRLLRSGQWVAGGQAMIGKSLNGARIGIVGLGAIGMALARRCELLGMDVAWWGPRSKPNAPWPQAASLAALARDTEILAICTSADPTNAGMISGSIIEAVGPEGLIVNVARGQLIDENALIDALRSGRLGGAALDVFAVEPTPASRWADVPNVICTPHIAGASQSSLPNMTAMLRANLDAYFSGHAIPNPAKPPTGSGM